MTNLNTEEKFFLTQITNRLQVSRKSIVYLIYSLESYSNWIFGFLPTVVPTAVPIFYMIY